MNWRAFQCPSGSRLRINGGCTQPEAAHFRPLPSYLVLANGTSIRNVASPSKATVVSTGPLCSDEAAQSPSAMKAVASSSFIARGGEFELHTLSQLQPQTLGDVEIAMEHFLEVLGKARRQSGIEMPGALEEGRTSRRCNAYGSPSWSEVASSALETLRDVCKLIKSLGILVVCVFIVTFLHHRRPTCS
ncbi:hypothetical protein C8J57DRAFT_1522461 [Mycena rebaudengoi]|nr:hypothetical protein C8J57DRAFT_1522461 [Mycena rebaudengoi]